MTETVTQTFPYPQALADLVPDLRHMPNYEFELVNHIDDSGATFLALDITHTALESLRQRWERDTHHLFIVPPATYNRVNWLRWIFDRIADVDNHERAEFFSVADHDACVHCGSHDDPDGDHSCPCPYRDGECKHTAPWYQRVFPPLHGNGNDPYFLWHVTTPEEVAKSPGDP